MTEPIPPTVPVRLTPYLQRYAWGDPTFIPDLLGTVQGPEACAEAWYGAHPLAPATAHLGGDTVPLDRAIADHPTAVLGPEVSQRFGGLPYLLKILAAGEPLSIQVHPNQAQAVAGFEREERSGIPLDAPNRSYRDRSHKPEILVALTGFDALCGFRPPHEITAALQGLPELRDLLPPLEPGPDGLRRLLDAYFALPASRLAPALAELIRRLEREASETSETSETSESSEASEASERSERSDKSPGPDDPRYWALRAHRALNGEGSPDRGILFVFLLDLVHLQPGEAVFLPAGVLHAYLAGAGVELMASSDNVLRAGLTSKHVDVAEVMRVTRFRAQRPPILRAVEHADGVTGTYHVPSPELGLQRVHLDGPTSIAHRAKGAETLLVLADDAATRVEVRHPDGHLELRRGQACLVPHGIGYEVTSTGPATMYRAGVSAVDDAVTFRGRRPAPLRFGTSGLRGRVEEITDLEAYVTTRGFLDFLVASGDAVAGMPVAVAGDLRPSTDGPDRSILRAVARAIEDAGFPVINGGRIPTPALTLYGLEHRCPSVMVTGSHIPFDRNGIKFNRTTGEVLKGDEAPILAAIGRVRQLEYTRRTETSRFDDGGWFRPGQEGTLPPVDDGPRAEYVRRYLDVFPDGALSGLRVVLYEHSAVGREVVAEILRGLGAVVHPMERADTFVAIDTEAIAADRLDTLQGIADRARDEVGGVDAIVSTDGDSDRPLLLGIDPSGGVRFIGGDVLGTLVADYLRADAVAVPVSSTDLIDRHLSGRGVELVRTRIGSPWVIAAMRELRGQRRVGWEANGGFLTGSSLALEGGRLAALPTRDAVLPIVAALHAAHRRAISLVDLVAELPARYSRSGLLDDMPPKTSQTILELLGAGDADAARRIARHFGPARGFGALEEVNTLDGVRLHFAGGDIAHVRPSGNAPQLRIYAVADTEARAEEIVAMALAEDGILRELAREADEHRYVTAIAQNVATTAALFADGEPAAVIGTVSGSAAACAFWQRQLDGARAGFRARKAISFHEDLPVNQAFGLLLLWERVRLHLSPGEGALVAFVFGEGSRAAPFTEAECGQKPALRSFVSTGTGSGRRPLSVVELALRTFAPVEHYLRRSGFEGMVVKWGDEVQIPSLDLSGTDPRLADADVVRFVSMREMTEETARDKDWVGVDAEGRVTAFIPRRPLGEMAPLADRGLLQRRGSSLVGGVNLGSIAVSRSLLDRLLQEFTDEVHDPTADRTMRPDLDPQLFTALTIAAIPVPAEREVAWAQVVAESPALATLDRNLPHVVSRLRGVLDAVEADRGRPVRLMAVDFGDQYWGDVGQHRQMHDLYMALLDRGPDGRIARALAGLPERWDRSGNLVAGDTTLGPGVRVRRSVLIDVQVDAGEIEGSVLLGTRCGTLHAREAFDVGSVVTALTLAPRAGSYRLVSDEPVSVGEGERATTVFLPDGDHHLRVAEDTDLRDRANTYDVPILGNPLSFREAHERVVAADPAEIERRRGQRSAEVLSRRSE